MNRHHYRIRPVNYHNLICMRTDTYLKTNLHKTRLAYAKQSIIYLFSLLCLAMTASNANAAQEITRLTKNTPALVLAGTTILSLDTFVLIDQIKPGRYSINNGEAILQIELTKTEQHWQIQRRLQVTGQKPVTKNYVAKVTSKPFLSNPEFSLIAIENGLLLYEKTPNADGIPADLWVLYLTE